jgi:hypothetical protein
MNFFVNNVKVIFIDLYFQSLKMINNISFFNNNHIKVEISLKKLSYQAT